MQVLSMMRRSVETWGAREAITVGQCRLTFAEAWDRGLRLANILLDQGIPPGARVAVLEDNTIEAVDSFLGCTAANLVRVPLYARNSPEAHAHAISHTGCRALLVSEKYAETLRDMKDSIEQLDFVLLRDDGYESLLRHSSPIDPEPAVSPDDCYIIRHTGGTTGKAKAVPITHRSWLAAARDWFYNFPPVEIGDACLHIGPISHGAGYLFTPIWISGGRNVLLEKFSADAALDVMSTEHIAYMFAVPTMLADLARQALARRRPWPDLKVIMVGGSPVSESTLRLAQTAFGDVLYQIYGQTEVTPITAIGPRELFSDVPGSEPLRSAGRVFPFSEVRIVDSSTRQELPIGAEGEIAARSDGQMDGFWNDPASTSQRVIDGWILTGDIGRLDSNGYLYILDRSDDMIISGGFNIYPAELENVISEHPSVVEVAVFAIPHERWGESPLAWCVVSHDSTVTESDIIDLCADRLGSYKKPSRVVLTTEPLPKSPVGKVMRKTLRGPFWPRGTRRVAGS